MTFKEKLLSITSKDDLLSFFEWAKSDYNRYQYVLFDVCYLLQACIKHEHVEEMNRYFPRSLEESFLFLSDKVSYGKFHLVVESAFSVGAVRQ